MASGVHGRMLLSVPGGGVSFACAGVGGRLLLVDSRRVGSTKRILDGIGQLRENSGMKRTRYSLVIHIVMPFIVQAFHIFEWRNQLYFK
jgi:hypothetical protein